MKSLKKVRNLLITIAIAAAVALPIGLTACGDPASRSGGKFFELNTAESVYGFSAASAGMLISAANGGDAAALASAKGVLTSAAGGAAGGEETADPTTDPVLAELEGYMTLVDSLLSDGGFNVVTETSDREGYAEKSTTTYTDLSGNTLSYVMYYNEIFLPDDDDDRDFGEVEEEYAIEGVLVVDGTDYAVRGERSYESEDGEEESETEFRVTLGENRYLFVEQGWENEHDETEQEYSYLLVENGRTIESSSFSYETEHDETELKMVSVSGGAERTFEFERETEHGRDVIRIRVGENGSEKTYIARVAENADGTVDYEFYRSASRG